ncbi:hypothetical protein BFJ70_g9605 [Fusarium oxysporum]|uniref:Uncharacterized protein n=3 Tax=Fusarium oxysporum TaxID=5507 RepID=A0A420PSB3_FUSOX|nr:hypothetical protein FOZG_07535 [Fusarium oxysporum Fo47]KAF5260142.1 hypothetical protein FOXYS1_9213 [Fusarium oxysporum]RKK18661.1 hypothetical protein BFJ65_g8958 [Fusarium oxysporum f. sp. cepae]RKK41651.1 hypothetical protein BFJ66_g10890 [Fusarium oxysporum f. sp. cepae]RKK95417.1 hypothetical protein BFJ71_g8440 [Fusarium oxysporum]
MGMYNGQEEHDNLVWDKNDEDFEAAQQQLRLKTFCRKVEGPLFFGKDPDDERAAMEPFVQRKLAESKDRLIVEWDETEAQKRFSELLFN